MKVTWLFSAMDVGHLGQRSRRAHPLSHRNTHPHRRCSAFRKRKFLVNAPRIPRGQVVNKVNEESNAKMGHSGGYSGWKGPYKEVTVDGNVKAQAGVVSVQEAQNTRLRSLFTGQTKQKWTKIGEGSSTAPLLRNAAHQEGHHLSRPWSLRHPVPASGKNRQS